MAEAAIEPQTHVVKCWPVYYDAISRGEKTFDVRKDDRGFQRGDYITLQRTRPSLMGGVQDVEYGVGAKARYEQTLRITWILTGGQFGIEPGYVVLALTPTSINAPKA